MTEPHTSTREFRLGGNDQTSVRAHLCDSGHVTIDCNANAPGVPGLTFAGTCDLDELIVNMLAAADWAKSKEQLLLRVASAAGGGDCHKSFLALMLRRYQ